MSVAFLHFWLQLFQFLFYGDNLHWIPPRRSLLFSLSFKCSCMFFEFLCIESDARKKPIVVQLATFIPLSYICICSFLSLFRLKMSVNYRLHTGQITPTLSLLDNAANFLKMNFPLGQNFLKLIGIRVCFLFKNYLT